jgi:transposase
MKFWTEVRRAVLVEGLSKRQACRKYKINFRTLQKILSHEEPPEYQQKGCRPKPKLDPFLPIIHEILQADKKQSIKQRHTSKKIFERLRDEHGYTGGKTVVQDEVRRWRRRKTEVFMPLAHPPGWAQLDFGEAKAVYRGREIKVMFCVMVLPHSDAFFCQVFPRECTETFQEGHRRAFEFFGGVPKRISYDNSKIAVRKIVCRRGETPTREFLRLQSHYLFEHHFCQIYRPNEKGNVEGMIGFARRNFMVPIPEFDDFETFNRRLADDCRKDMERKLWGQTEPKIQLLEIDRQAMLPLAKRPFESRRIEMPKCNSLSLVRFDRNDYSIPTEYAHHRVTAVGGIDRVRLVVDDRVVAEHVRDWGRENVHYDPVHYLALLEKKPNSLDFGRPFEHWDLPDSFAVLRRRLENEAGSDGRREFIKVLRLLENHSLPELGIAIDRALGFGATTAEAIRILLQENRERPVKLFRLDNRPHLQDHVIPQPNLKLYDTLREGTNSHEET